MRQTFWRMVPGKQLDLLRQVARVFTELPAIPVAQLGAIETHLAGGGQSRHPTRRRASVDLPEPDGPTTASDSPGCQLQAHAVEDRLLRCLAADRASDRRLNAHPARGNCSRGCLPLQGLDRG